MKISWSTMLGVKKIPKVQDVNLTLSIWFCDLQVYQSPSLHSLQQLSLLHCIRYNNLVSFTAFEMAPPMELLTPFNYHQWKETWICSYAPKDSSDSQWRQRQSQFIMLTNKSTGIGLMKHMDACASQSLEIFSSTSMDWRLPRRFGIFLIVEIL